MRRGPGRRRRHGAGSAAMVPPPLPRSPPGPPQPSAPRAAANMAEGPRPAAPALTCQPQPRRRAGRGRAAGGAEKEEGKDEDNEEEKAGGAAAEAAAAAMIAAPLGQDAPPRCRALAATSGGSGAAPAPSRDGDGLAPGQRPARHCPRAREQGQPSARYCPRARQCPGRRESPAGSAGPGRARAAPAPPHSRPRCPRVTQCRRLSSGVCAVPSAAPRANAVLPYRYWYRIETAAALGSQSPPVTLHQVG